MKKLLIAICGLSLLLSCKSDLGLEPTRSGFRGTIHFKNSWPAQTDQVLVVAATKFPPTAITEIIMGDPLPLNVDSVEYQLFTPPQSFAAVGVVWKEKDQPWDVTNIIGIYFDSEDHFNPGDVTVASRQQLINNINIDADLAKAKLAVKSGIEGTLHIKGLWPSGSQSILLAASRPILPSGLLDISLGTPVSAPFDSTRYFLSLQPGTYRLVGALLIQEGVSLGISSLVGLYYKKPGDLFPGTVIIPNDTTRIRNINFTIDFNSKPFPG
jgi:hypothetical protein